MSENERSILEVKQKTVAGMFWRFAERVLAQGVNVLVSILLARILLPEEYGIVALVLIVINIANSLVTSGLGTSLIQKKDADEIDFSTMFYTGLVLSLILYMIVFAIAPLVAEIYHQPILTSILRVIGLRLPIAAVNSIQQAYVAKNLMFRKFFLATLFGTALSAFVGIYMAVNGYGAWALVGQYLTNVTVDTIMLFITVKWHPRLVFSYVRMKELLSFGGKIMAASFIGTVFNQLKGLLIGAKYTSSDLAFSAQGEKIPIFFAGNIEATLDSVLFPVMSIFQDDKVRMKAAVRRSMRISAYIITPLMFGLAAVSENLVMIILSEEWLDCVPYMQVASIQQVFGIVGVTNLQALKALGRSDITLKLEFIKKPIYFFILLITMQVSPLAVAIGTGVYAIIGTIINAWPNIRLLNYKVMEQIEDILIPLVLSIIMYIVVDLIGKVAVGSIGGLFIQIFIGIIFYVSVSKILHIESFEYVWNMMCEFKKKTKM